MKWISVDWDRVRATIAKMKKIVAVLVLALLILVLAAVIVTVVYVGSKSLTRTFGVERLLTAAAIVAGIAIGVIVLAFLIKRSATVAAIGVFVGVIGFLTWRLGWSIILWECLIIAVSLQILFWILARMEVNIGVVKSFVTGSIIFALVGLGASMLRSTATEQAAVAARAATVAPSVETSSPNERVYRYPLLGTETKTAEFDMYEQIPPGWDYWVSGPPGAKIWFDDRTSIEVNEPFQPRGSGKLRFSGPKDGNVTIRIRPHGR